VHASSSNSPNELVAKVMETIDLRGNVVHVVRCALVCLVKYQVTTVDDMVAKNNKVFVDRSSEQTPLEIVDLRRNLPERELQIATR
jgi:hypothetical protein